jgi:hypothetical protein
VAKIEFEFLGVCLGDLGDSAVAFERMSEELLDKTRNDQNKRGIHMRYMMKQKLFSLGADFTIKDEQGNDVYFVDGKFLSLRDELTFKDMAGNELCVLRRKLLSWGPTYEIYHQGQLVAVVKESLFTLFGHQFFRPRIHLHPRRQGGGQRFQGMVQYRRHVWRGHQRWAG